jgi:hypothetical protein
MSTLFVNNLNTASGSTITVPTGKRLVVTDEGGVRVPGSVIQVVNSTKSGAVTNTSQSSYVDTGLTATITPKYSSSKTSINITRLRCISNSTRLG